MSESGTMPAKSDTRWPRWLLPALVSFAVLLSFFASQRHLYDTDASYHLAIARQIAESGVPATLPQLRASALGAADGFGDKELGFHLLLAPLVRFLEPIRAGQVALALLGAALFTLIATLGRPLLGRWAWALPLLVAPGSLEVAWRLVRLRPELLSLLLFIVAIDLAARGRHRWLGAVALVYALSYTAFHAFVGYFVLWFLVDGATRRGWRIERALYPALGAGIGLLVHPNFPANLRIWTLQNLDFFAAKATLDVGSEIAPQSTAVAFTANLGWLLGALALVACTRLRTADDAPPNAPDLQAERARGFALAATVFGVLWLLMSRFSIYAFPFATLALVAHLGRERVFAPRRVLPALFGRRAAAAWLVAPALLTMLWTGSQELRRFRQRNDPGPNLERLRDREAWAAALPQGAHVAARWQQTPIYLLAAPWGRYLNALDPIFMARPYPEVYARQRRLFLGDEPDPAMALATALDSRFVAFGATEPTGDLKMRLDHDPRFVARYGGNNWLYELAPAGAARDFVVDWRLVPASAGTPPVDGIDGSSWPRYPVSVDPALRALEAFADLRRIPSGDAESYCFLFARPAANDETEIELSAWGPTTVWQGQRRLVEVPGARAVLGRGTIVRLPASDVGEWTSVRTCGLRGEPAGFYWRRLDAS
jgi:hypothetical protein